MIDIRNLIHLLHYSQFWWEAAASQNGLFLLPISKLISPSSSNAIRILWLISIGLPYLLFPANIFKTPLTAIAIKASGLIPITWIKHQLTLLTSYIRLIMEKMWYQGSGWWGPVSGSIALSLIQLSGTSSSQRHFNSTWSFCVFVIKILVRW